MIKITLYSALRYYQNKWGEKEYILNQEDEIVYLQASLLSGRPIKQEENYLHSVYGETKEEALKSLRLYLKANPKHPKLHRYEIETTKQ